MAEADVTYVDVKFARQRASGTFSSSADTTYSEVNILNSEQPTSENGSKQQAGSNRKSKVTSERAALLVLGVLLVAAVIALGVTVFHNVETEKKLKEFEDEKSNKGLTGKRVFKILNCTEQDGEVPADLDCFSLCCYLFKDEPVQKCEVGWEHHVQKCYYFNKMKYSWTKSRDECRRKGGDLVKIDSREEQRFLEARLRDKMEEDEDKFWIGLTDSEEEGRWLWADRSPLDTCLTFWSPDEPDNWTENNSPGEDCVRMGQKGGAGDLRCWFDHSCDNPHKSICEKAAQTRLNSPV
ncbi:C-type lectin domain family 4 member E-like [Leuresthes tenuis]|uniref:C-type lectin domain family 4 member E-like n=1 Tax=Leuresthes tenuis TaxID=355514 RepID=UPI003B5076BB